MYLIQISSKFHKYSKTKQKLLSINSMGSISSICFLTWGRDRKETNSIEVRKTRIHQLTTKHNRECEWNK